MAGVTEQAHGGPTAMTGAHPEHEDHSWTIEIPDHPKRTDSAEYVASRKVMNVMARTVGDLLNGDAPYQAGIA
jgi:hypothetical protein